jgi:hypothetical protein
LAAEASVFTSAPPTLLKGAAIAGAPKKPSINAIAANESDLFNIQLPFVTLADPVVGSVIS